MTLFEWVDKCRETLSQANVWFGHGTDNAQDEAAWLVLAAISAPVDKEFSDWEIEASLEQESSIQVLLEKRIQTRKPLAYLTGEAWFCGLRFMVDKNVLVPRSPIAELISNQFTPWIQPGVAKSVLDLCTGCGCIAIATAVQMPWLKVDASDLSSEALKIAAGNMESHGVGDRVELFESDLFNKLTGRRYDLVISNPPYVSGTDFESLPREYQAEPEMALVTGMRGLEIPLQILQQTADYLEPDGVLICEVGENAEQLQSLLPGLPFTWLEFNHGGGGVFVIGREGLLKHRVEVSELMEKLKNVV